VLTAAGFVRQIVTIPLAALALYTLAFALVNLVPSDPARVIAGSNADQATLDAIRHSLGLDRPVGERYIDSLVAMAHGDLGTSYFTHRPVWTEISERLPSSLELVVLTIATAVVYGIALGGAAAYFEGRAPDRMARFIVAVSQSIPDFLIGVILIFVFFFLLRLAPAPVGQLAILDQPPPRVTGAALVDALLAGDIQVAGSAASHAVLPVITLALFLGALFAKTTRANLGEALRGPAAEFARGCGLSEWRVFWWAFKQSRTPLLTYIGLTFAILIGGEAIVEVLFAWNGLGQWALTEIVNLDVPVIQAYVLIVGAMSLVIYTLMEVIVTALDPRLSPRAGR
jgi:peptide/nickel transport system permease protein